MTQQTLTGDAVTRVVNRKEEEFTVDIGRSGGTNHMNNTPVGEPGWIGNPYPEAEYGRERCIELFREDFHDRLQSDPEFRRAVENLQGEVLGCYCKPRPCHGDVIVEFLRSLDGSIEDSDE